MAFFYAKYPERLKKVTEVAINPLCRYKKLVSHYKYLLSIVQSARCAWGLEIPGIVVCHIFD